MKIFNPLEYPEWNELVLASQGYCFFHTAQWARILNESYGYKPLYFVLAGSKGFLAMAPVMEVRSFLTGKRGVSLPFSDYSSPIFTEATVFQESLRNILEYGKKSGWRTLELRGGQACVQGGEPDGIPVFSRYLRHEIDLACENINQGVRSSTGRNIRKAQKAGVTVSMLSTSEAVHEFYRLNCMTRKRHGLPPQPPLFFAKLHEHAISKGLGMVAQASYGGRVIASCVFLHIGQKALYKYGASDMRYQRLRGNNLVIWEAINWYRKRGFQRLCLGRTEPENEGLKQFKAGWGTKEDELKYYRYDFSRGEFVTGRQTGNNIRRAGNNIRRAANSMRRAFFTALPLPVSRLIGAALYRHVG